MAPNLVTLLGFFCILSNVLLLVLYQPTMDGTDPSWLYYSFALGLWAYSTMDNIDGKQARRTGTSSPLGELFDHGIDSLNCTLGSLLEAAAMGLGNSKSAVFTSLVPCLPMFFSTWETYHTHTLYLGVINGPTEGLILACSVMGIAGHWGPGVWTQPLVNFFGPTFWPSSWNEVAFRDVWVGIIVVSLFATHIPFCVRNVVAARRRDGLPVAPVFLEWTPMAVFTLSVGAWLLSPHSTLRDENHLVLFCLTMSFVFGRMTTKIILAHLTKQPFPYWTVMLWPLVGGAITFNLPVLGFAPLTAGAELWYLRMYFVFAVVVYFRWAFLVINSICGYLGINCLTIPEKKLRDMEIDRKIAEQVKNMQSTQNGAAQQPLQQQQPVENKRHNLRSRGPSISNGNASIKGKLY